MNHIPEILIVLYLIVGILLATIGPAGADIRKEMERTRGTPLLNAYHEREAPSELKLFIFRALITAGFVLMWPVFIGGIVKAKRQKREESQALEDKISQGLWFHYLGGYGAISCHDCSHGESITSFTHGRDSSTAGFQCQGCSKFASIHSSGHEMEDEYKSRFICECGGKLEREKVLFCPKCKSKNLSYEMEFIT